MIPTFRFGIHEDHVLIITYWLNDSLRGQLGLVLYSLVFKLLLHSEFGIIIRFVLAWSLTEHKVIGETSGLSAPIARNQGVYAFLKIGLSETPYPAFPGSKAINSHAHFVGLAFLRVSLFLIPKPSTKKIHDSQEFKTKIHDSYMVCNYDSWFMIPLPPPKYMCNLCMSHISTLEYQANKMAAAHAEPLTSID